MPLISVLACSFMLSTQNHGSLYIQYSCSFRSCKNV